MRFLFRLFVRLLLVLVIVIPIVVGIGIVMAFGDNALVPIADAPNARDVARGKRLLAQNDPRKLKDGAIKAAKISARDLSLMANHAVNLVAKGGVKGRALVEIERKQLKGLASIELPRNPLGRFLNVEADLQANGGRAQFTRLRIGDITVPGWLADFATVQALNWYFKGQGTGLVSEFIQSVDFDTNALLVSYRWSADAVERVRSHIVSPQTVARLRAFHLRLVDVAAGHGRGTSVSLLELMKPLFEMAQARSEDGNAAAENSAAIIVMSTYVNGRSVNSLVPEAAQWPKVPVLGVTLNSRKDTAQHYLTSAALTVMGSGALSDAIGLFKEVDDSRGGSGFSFNDLAADRTGTRFAELAGGSDSSAQTAQLRISQAQRELDIMPEVSDLAERMSEAQFKQRYGGVDSPSYRQVTEDIERRIAATRLFR